MRHLPSSADQANIDIGSNQAVHLYQGSYICQVLSACERHLRGITLVQTLSCFDLEAITKLAAKCIILKERQDQVCNLQVELPMLNTKIASDQTAYVKMHHHRCVQYRLGCKLLLSICCASNQQ